MANPPRRRAAVDSTPSADKTLWQRPWVRFIARWFAVVVIWLTLAVGGVVVWYGTDLPDVTEAIAATRRPAITIVAADGTELATTGELHGVPVQVGDLPPALPSAVLSIEDRRFYWHFGVDVLGLARAVFVNLRAGRVVQGGSTITQQVAKNLFLTPERTFKRKVQELLLALWLEHKFTKDQILALYLNRAYFGAGTFGVDAAARKYFGVSATRVSTYQAAMLAGLLRAPSRYNPRANPDLASERTDVVLASMVDAGVLSRAEAEAARQFRGSFQTAGSGRYDARYFVDWVLTLIPAFVGDGDRDLVVMTTLDSRLQGIAEQRLADAVGAAAQDRNVSQAALLSLSPDGAVRAMVGGKSYRESQFNRAVQARRQPGSAFKPLVYVAGLEAGLSPESRFVDGPLSIGGWRPRNFNGRFEGEVTVQDSLARSINTVAVQISEKAGRKRVVEVARRFGVTGDMRPTASLALGAAEISLIELTAAYAVFANGGYGVWPYAIETIQDATGQVLYRRQGSGPGRVVSRDTAGAITRMMVAAITTGTGKAARLARPAAGKTGTSQENRDAWFIGFTADLVTGVWMGNDNDTPMKGVTGGGLPAKLWHAFMTDAEAGWPVRPLPGVAPPPPPMVQAPIPRQRPAPEPPRERNLLDRIRDLFNTEES